MSYANGTAHYNLPQTVGTDKRDWFDTNTAFANVDADLYSAKQSAETAVTDIQNVEGDVTALTTRVQTSEGKISNLESGLATTNENLGTVSTTLNGLVTEVGNNMQDLEDMIEPKQEASATSAHAYAIGDYFIYNDTLCICTVAIRVGDTIVPNVNCNTTDIMTRIKALENTSIIDDSSTASDKVWSANKVNTQLGNKQNKTDNSLTTTSKTVVGAINELKSASDSADGRLDALEASELFETRVAINCNTAVSGITPFAYKGTSLTISSDTTVEIYSVTVEKPPSGEWVFSVDVNQTDRTVTVYANGSATVYADIAYHKRV